MTVVLQFSEPNRVVTVFGVATDVCPDVLNFRFQAN
jgi:hypothetical protein